MQVAEAVMTLIAFIPVLWALSKGVGIEYLKDIPGSLVWIALTVSLGGTAISWIVGKKLPGLEYNNQKVEAALFAGLTPVICVGETEEERKDGKTEEEYILQFMKKMAIIITSSINKE